MAVALLVVGEERGQRHGNVNVHGNVETLQLFRICIDVVTAPKLNHCALGIWQMVMA